MKIARLGRRRFLGAAALSAGFPLLRAGAAVPPQSAVGLVARRLYFTQPDYESVGVSPDGKHLAYLAPAGGVRNLFIATVDEPRRGRLITRVLDRDIASWYAWAYTNRHIVFFQDRDGDENWRASSVDIGNGAVTALTPSHGVRSFIQQVSHLFPDEVLVRHNERDRRYFDLYRVNVITGAVRLVYENRDFVWLVTDASFRLRLGGRYAADGSLDLVERRDDGSWAPFATVPIGDLDSTRFIGFSADGNTLHLIDTRGRDKAALVAIDMPSRRSKVLAEDGQADIVRVELDPRSRLPLAAMAVKDRTRWHAIESATQRDLV